jgi:hypothetical protein
MRIFQISVNNFNDNSNIFVIYPICNVNECFCDRREYRTYWPQLQGGRLIFNGDP